MHWDDFDAVLFDMDGTLVHENHALPGAAETVAVLLDAGQRVACLTNASSRSAEDLSRRLTGLGIELPPAAIHTAGQAMADGILARWPRPRVVNFAGRAFGRLLIDKATMVTSLDEAADVVAVGTHMRADNVPFDMPLALLALEHLRCGAHLAMGCADRIFPIPGATCSGSVEFGSGSWAALFVFAANLPPERVHYYGKPEPVFYHDLCQRLDVRPERCVLIGDNLESDIRGALGVGMKTVLLLSGVTRMEDLTTTTIRPHLVCANLTEAAAKLRRGATARLV